MKLNYKFRQNEVLISYQRRHAKERIQLPCSILVSELSLQIQSSKSMHKNDENQSVSLQFWGLLSGQYVIEFDMSHYNTGGIT